MSFFFLVPVLFESILIKNKVVLTGSTVFLRIPQNAATEQRIGELLTEPSHDGPQLGIPPVPSLFEKPSQIRQWYFFCFFGHAFSVRGHNIANKNQIDNWQGGF